MFDEQETKLAQCAQAVGAMISHGQYIPPSDRQKLMQKKAILESELVRVNDAIAVLDAHPDLEEFVKTLQAGLR